MPNPPADWTAQRLLLRQLREEDFDAVVALQLRCFPGMKTWTKEQFQSQITTFPEGQLGIFADGRLVASSASLVVNDADYSNWANWVEMSDHGFIRNHDPEGDSLYGIEIMVDPELRGMKLARRLYDARKELCRRKDLARIIVGGRIPGYARHKEEMSAREYVERVLDKSLFDPVLTVQIANGFQMRELVKDYMPSDEDSSGWATCLEWPNLDHTTLHSHRSRRSVAPVRVSAVQFKMRQVASFEEFARQCEFFVDVASDQKSDFVLFPELFTLQLLSVVPPSRPGTAARTLAEMTPRYLELFRGLAVRYDVNVIGGSQFVVEDGHLYNASYLFRRDGSLDRQLKLHVTPNESRWWGVRGGDRLEVFETDRGRISIQICYDVEFPELSRSAAHRGAQLLFVPFNTNDRVGFLRVLRCAQARCIENQIYTVTAGCVGNLPSVENADTHYAASGIYTPSDVSFARDGIAAEVSPNIETVITQDLDTELLRRARRSGTVRNWADRRTDLYRVRWSEGDKVEEV
jgi:predicted amidohydrolase/ribosomal protein S18 acetylase RimI-like enzyme